MLDWMRFALHPAGVTGSRHGISSFQRGNLMSLLLDCRPPELHHGDCTGADAEAHALARMLGSYIVIHPPLNARFRAFSDPLPHGESRAPAPYLDRNRAIVGEVSFLIALPDRQRPASTAGSGTWTTVSYAENAGMGTAILYPDGRIEVDGMPLVR